MDRLTKATSSWPGLSNPIEINYIDFDAEGRIESVEGPFGNLDYFYDATGRLVNVLADGTRTAGDYRAYWDGTDRHKNRAASGVYFIRLTAGNQAATQRIVLLR